MGVEDVKKIVAEMNAKEIDVESQLIEIATPTIKATDEMIEITEKNLGVILPESYKIFLKEYSNGNIFLLGVEPLVSVGLDVGKCRCTIRNSDLALHLTPCPNKECFIFPENRGVKLGQLIAFTYGDYYDMSNNHWAFICDRNYPDNNYPVGYVSDDPEKIICVLESFEKWLEVFWKGNKDRNGEYESVFNLLYPDYEDRCSLRDDLNKPSDYTLYKAIKERNKENFKRYGIK